MRVRQQLLFAVAHRPEIERFDRRLVEQDQMDLRREDEAAKDPKQAGARGVS